MIRQLLVSDSEKFRDLRLETLLKDPGFWYSKYEVEKDFPLSDFTSRIAYSTSSPMFGYYGYFDEEKLLAYVQISSNYWAKKKHVVIVSDVCVSPERRKSGIGSELMKFVIEKAKEVPDVEQIELWVNSSNTIAASFYEKLGFKKVAEIPESLKESDGTYQNEYVYILKI